MKKKTVEKATARKQHGKWEAGLRNVWPLKVRIEKLEAEVRDLQKALRDLKQ